MDQKHLRYEIKKHLSKYIILPPQVYDLLATLRINQYDKELNDSQKYYIYTRKPKGSKFINPVMVVDKTMFDAVKTVLRNHQKSIMIESQDIRFYKNTGELRIWGFSLYIKKNTDRFILCNYMFGKKRQKNSWEVEDLVIALGYDFDPSDRKRHFDQINSKIRELNKDVEQIGFEKFIISEGGCFVVNGMNKPVIN